MQGITKTTKYKEKAQSGNEYDTVKYQAIGHLSIEEIAKKAREKLAKRKEAKNG